MPLNHAAGGHGYFQLKLQDLIAYPEIKSEVLQTFREVGNALVFLKFLDQALVGYLGHCVPSSPEIQHCSC